MRILIDTSAYSGFRRGHEGVGDLVRRSERVLFSPVVAGELLHGFRKGSHLERNRRELDDFLENPLVELLPVTLTTADRYSMIMKELRARGVPIPTNDVWIAAQAFETGADLVSFDQHFGKIAGLAWIDPGTRV